MRVVFGKYLLTIQACESEADWVRELRSIPIDSQVLIGSENATRYHLVRVSDDRQSFVVGVRCQDHGLTPNVLLLEDDLLVFGADFKVIGVTCSNRRVAFEHELPGLFYRSYRLPSNRLLALHELGVTVMSVQGDLLWGYDKDVVEEIEITSTSIRLAFMDAPAVRLDVETGCPIE